MRVSEIVSVLIIVNYIELWD